MVILNRKKRERKKSSENYIMYVQARSWRYGQYGHGRTSIWGFTTINKGWPDLDFGVKLAAAVAN